MREHWAPLIILFVCLAATAVITTQMAETINLKDSERFQAAAQRVRAEITTRLETYTAMLHAAAGLFAAEPNLEASQFRAFVERLELQTRYPGIQGIGFSRRLTPAALDDFVAQRRMAGQVGFRVWPATPRSEYHTITYLEPLDRRNRAALGYDMFTEQVRRAAMEKARDTGSPIASGLVTLVQEIDEQKQRGFLIYLPVYRGGAVPESVAERRERLLGFMYSPFRAGDLFEGIVRGGQSPRFGFRLDDERQNTANLLHQSAGFTERPRFSTEQSIDVAGRRWLLSVTSSEGFERGSARDLVPLVAIAGVGVSGAVAWLVLLQARARRRAETSEAEQRDSERELQTLYVEVQRLLESERRLRGDAERVSQLKDEFLATLSHELRTPLNAILGWTQVLSSDDSAESRERALATIQRNARAQARLIDDLLDMSRIISGKVRLEMKEVDVRDVVEAAMNVVRPTAEAKGVRLETTIDPRPGVVRADPNRLQQVTWNLLTNAIKFTPAGGRVHVGLRHVDGRIEVSVSDTGVGIDPAFLPFAFDRFRQADGSTTRHHGGLGLGLSIVKSLVEMHGGSIRAESAGPGQGSTFAFMLPPSPRGEAAVRQEAAARAEDAERRAPAAEVSLDGARVLVVDDDADTRELLHTVLRAHRAEVKLAASADEALRLLGSDGGFDLVVSDLAMPGVDGYELMRRVRAAADERVRAVRAIALSAYARSEDRKRAGASGYDLHVSKPFDAGRLVRACADLLGRAGRN